MPQAGHGPPAGARRRSTWRSTSPPRGRPRRRSTPSCPGGRRGREDPAPARHAGRRRGARRVRRRVRRDRHHRAQRPGWLRRSSTSSWSRAATCRRWSRTCAGQGAGHGDGAGSRSPTPPAARSTWSTCGSAGRGERRGRGTRSRPPSRSRRPPPRSGRPPRSARSGPDPAPCADSEQRPGRPDRSQPRARVESELRTRQESRERHGPRACRSAPCPTCGRRARA